MAAAFRIAPHVGVQPFAMPPGSALLLAGVETSGTATALSTATNDSTAGGSPAVDNVLAGPVANSLGGSGSAGDSHLPVNQASVNDGIDSALRAFDEIPLAVSDAIAARSGEMSAPLYAAAVDRVFAATASVKES